MDYPTAEEELKATTKRLWEQVDITEKLAQENARLKEREKLCETMDQAEKLALIRSLQEIRDEVGLLGDGVSPRQIVDAVRNLKANSVVSTHSREATGLPCPRIEFEHVPS